MLRIVEQTGRHARPYPFNPLIRILGLERFEPLSILSVRCSEIPRAGATKPSRSNASICAGERHLGHGHSLYESCRYCIAAPLCCSRAERRITKFIDPRQIREDRYAAGPGCASAPKVGSIGPPFPIQAGTRSLYAMAQRVSAAIRTPVQEVVFPGG
jgi:hypothetical protein